MEREDGPIRLVQPAAPRASGEASGAALEAERLESARDRDAAARRYYGSVHGGAAIGGASQRIHRLGGAYRTSGDASAPARAPRPEPAPINLCAVPVVEPDYPWRRRAFHAVIFLGTLGLLVWGEVY